MSELRKHVAEGTCKKKRNRDALYSDDDDFDEICTRSKTKKRQALKGEEDHATCGGLEM